MIDTNALRLPESKTIRPKRNPQSRKSVYPFKRFLNSMPLEWVVTACALPGKSLQVGLAIWDLTSLNKSPKVSLAKKHLSLFAVKRHSTYRALKHLEKAGLITVDRKVGRAPIVTILERFYPKDRTFA